MENRWNEEDLRQRREELQSYWEEEFGERYRQLNDGKDPEIEKYFLSWMITRLLYSIRISRTILTRWV